MGMIDLILRRRVTSIPEPDELEAAKPKPLFTPEEQEENRETVKSALRLYSHRFNMSDWASDDRYESALQRGRADMERFLACGSAVCIAGMCGTLFPQYLDFCGGNLNRLASESLGVNQTVCFTDDWDKDLREVYLNAYEDGDQAAMVEAACQQIDRLAT